MNDEEENESVIMDINYIISRQRKQEIKKEHLEELLVCIEKEIRQLKEDKKFLSSNFNQLTELSQKLSVMYQERGLVIQEEKKRNSELLEQVARQQSQISELQNSIEDIQQKNSLLTEESSILRRREEELQKKLREQSEELREKSEELREKSEELREKNEELREKSEELREKSEELREKSEELREKNEELREKSEELREKSEELREKNQELREKSEELREKNEELREKSEELREKNEELREKNQELREKSEELREKNQELREKSEELREKIEELREQQEEYHTLEEDLEREREDFIKTKLEKDKLEEIARKLEKSWIIINQDVTFANEELGRGAWGAVRVGVFREQRVAVKQLHMTIEGEHSLALLNREINTMSKLRHPNLLLFIGAVLDHPSGHPLIITEIMDTSLRQAYEKGQLTDNKGIKLYVLRDTAAGLNYLHCHPDEIIHRDVSSANVLLESRGPNKWRAKLSDFGSANVARDAFTQAPGAAVYSAPESLVSVADDPEEKPQTTKMDVFSYGVLLCEVMTSSFPNTKSFQTMLQRIHRSNPPIGQLVRDCISRDPHDRPTMKQVIQQIDQQE